MDKTSLTIFSKEYDANLKLDYFLCSVAGALFAYIGQAYIPHKLDNWYYWITPLALTLLTISFGCSLRKFRLINLTTENNRRAHFSAEENITCFNEIQKHENNPLTKTTCRYTRKVQSLEELKAIKDNLEKSLEAYELKANKFQRKADTIGTARTLFLIIGFILILAAKVLQPYIAVKP